MQVWTKITPSTAEKFLRIRVNCTILFAVLLLGTLTVFETDLFQPGQHILTTRWALVFRLYTGILVSGAYLFYCTVVHPMEIVGQIRVRPRGYTYLIETLLSPLAHDVSYIKVPASLNRCKTLARSSNGRWCAKF